MFLFGHLGIGSQLVSPFTRNLSYRAVLLGTLLPDLIDKPLYYGLSFFAGKKGADLGMISGTRTVGHTALLLLVLTVIAILKKSKWLAALSLGIASHLVLDSLGDQFSLTPLSGLGTKDSALLWPLTGWEFPTAVYGNLKEHLLIVKNPFLMIGEAFGFALLLGDYFRRKRARRLF